MKKNVALSAAICVLIAAMLACALPGGTSPTVTPVPATQTPLASPTPIPTVEPLTATPSPAADAPARIQFAPNSTWMEVAVTGHANQPARFVLSAMQDQVMSVSVYENWGFPVMVTGQDGTLLSLENSDDAFWRGTLPATQDYFITVTPQMDGPFTLRVNINPPGQAEQLFQFEGTAYPVSLTYSDLFSPVNFPYADQLRGQPVLALNFDDTTFYNKTNLGEAYFVLALSTDASVVAACTQLEPYVEARGEETINGLTYVKGFSADPAAGNLYAITTYRTVHANVCLEVIFFVHSTNIGNYTPGTVSEYEDAALTQKLMEVFQTLVVK